MKFLTHLRQPRGLYWIALGVVVLVQVGIVWLLPILPAQDLPQHLAYARILRDHRVPNLPFGEVYEPVAGFQPYFMFHYALAGMGRVGGIDWACRVLFSLYIVTLTLALNRLSRAVSAGNGREPRWSTFLAPLATWSPIACMGFVPFLFAIPALLMGCASVATASEVPTVRHGIIAALWAAVVVSLHPVAAGCLIVYAGCYWGGKRTRKSLVVVCTVLGSVLVAQIAWGLVSDHGLGTFANVEWSEPRKRALGLDFITEAFKIRWPDPFLNLSYCLWTAFGPYRATGQITVAGAILIAAIISWRCRGRSSAEPASEGTNSAAVQAALAFFAIAWLAPWGFFLPSEITFLNLRLISLSGAIALASLSGKLFVSTASKVAAWGLAMFVALHFGLRAQKFNAEASVALGLLDEARPPGKMLPIVFHNTSAQFGKQFALTHFLPMY